MNILRVSLACFFLASQYLLISAYADPDQAESGQTEGHATVGEREGSAIVGNVSSGVFRHDFIPENNVQRNNVPGMTSMKDVSYQDVPQGYAPYKYPDPQTMVVNEYINNGAGLMPMGPDPFQPIFRLDKGIGGGIGYDDGYSNLGVLLPFTINPDQSMLFLDLRAMVTDQGAGGVNLGAGWRAYNENLDKIFTVAGWYDYDDGHYQDYHQIGLSGEVIGQYLTTRVNGYFPINNKDMVVSNNLNGSAYYQSHYIYLNRTTRTESSYGGVDAEVGGPLPVLGKFGIDGYVGGYYYNSDNDKSASGAKFRAEANINDWWQMSVSYARDSVFGSNAWMNVTLSIPEGRSDKWMRPKTLQQRMYQPMNRNYRVVAHVKEEINSEVAINPDDNMPYMVQHIDPDYAGAGDGTYEMPFGSVAAYNASPPTSMTDIIFVQSGNTANLDGQLTLLDKGVGVTGQRLLSESIQHTFKTYDLSSSLVTLNLPGYNPAASAPQLSYSAGTGGGGLVGSVVVGQGGAWEVSGFNISGARTGGALAHNSGIRGFNSRGFNVNNNSFSSYFDGVRIDNTASGIGIVENNTFSGDGVNSQRGARILHSSGTLELAFHNNTATNNTFITPPGVGVGFDIIATGAGTAINGVGTASDGVTTLGITGNTANNNGTGMKTTALAGATFITDKSNNTFNGNINPNTGLHVLADGPGSSVIFRSFDTITASNNTGKGIAFTATNGGLVSALSEDLNQNGTLDPGEDLNGNGALDLGMTNINASNNTLDGFLATSDGTNSKINVNIGNANATTNVFNGNGQNGISLNTLDTGTIGGSIVNNSAIGNTQDGLAVTLNTGTIDLTAYGSPSIGSNTLTGNTRHGMSIVNNDGGVFTTALISANDFSNNTEAGLFIGGAALGGANTAVNTLGSIDSNNFNRTTLGTYGIQFGSSDVRTTASITRNTFVGRAPNLPDAGAGPGVGGIVGGTTTVGGNGGVTLAFGSLAAVDNSLVNTFSNNGDAHIGLVFEGNATNQVDIDQHDFNTTTDTTVNTDFSGQGVGFILRDTATMTGTIQRNTFQGNAASGLFFSVTGNNGVDFAQINNMVVGGSTAPFGNTFTGNGGSGLEVIRTANGVLNNFTAQFNTLTGNTLDGISLTAANANITDTYTINDNTITGNTQNGIDISVQADAILQANMARNTITGNLNDGIRTTEMTGDPTDLRSVTGTWVNNTISGNTANGIELAGASSGLIIGGAGVNRNIIQSNGVDGVDITGGGSVTLNNNLIASNTMHGVDMELVGSNNITIINNDITLNNGDGIEFTNVNSGPSYTLTIEDNIIDFNQGRGFDLLAKSGGNNFQTNITVDFNGNIVNANTFEGVYVVYTSSANQTQVTGNTALLADGGLFRDLRLRMNMDSNMILANGSAAGFSTTGLVVRVGTSNASNSTTDNGGFASNGAGVFTRSGVIMDVTNNTLTGNFGADAYFESFVSTNNPAATAGTWGATNDPTVITTFESDPLARLDLNWDNNTVIATDVNNSGASYNVSDTFKSRLNTVAVTPGPFTSNTRLRNAQRQAARIANLNAPGAGTFLYSGTGASTFRVNSAGDTAPFILDTFPFAVTPNDANGVFLGNLVGELPFGWGQY